MQPGAPRTPTLSLYCQGLNQSSSGTAKNAALINLHLATGQIGRAGAGPFSLTGQPNAMGGREVGGLANLLSAHRDLADPQHRAEVAALWGVDSVPATPGKPAVEMFQAAADGEIKALWIACTNPAQSMPDQAMVRRALERAEFVVVQEAFATTATCDHADLLLPATTWGEKDGTVTNSERRISRVNPALAGARQRAPRLGHRHRLRAAAAGAAGGRGAAPSAGRVLLPYADAAVALERAPREHARPRPRHHRPQLRTRSRSHPRNGPSRPARARAASGSTKTASSRPPMARHASSTPRSSRSPSRATRASRSRSTPAACATSGTA